MTHQWKIAEKFSVNYYPDATSRNKRFVDLMGKVKTFRVSGFYRIKQPKSKKVIVDPKEIFLDDMITDILREEYDAKSDREKLLGRLEVRLEQCRFEDAEFIYGYSVDYPMVPIEWCNYLGDIGWSPEHLEEARQEYEDGLNSEWEYEKVGHSNRHPRFLDQYKELSFGGLEGGNRIEDDEYIYHSMWAKKYDGCEGYEVL